MIAAGVAKDSLAFHSRYAAETVVYRPPQQDPSGCIADILVACEGRSVDLIMPGVESTLVALAGARGLVESRAPLAAAPDDALRYALDKREAMALARRLGIPVPVGVTIEALALTGRGGRGLAWAVGGMVRAARGRTTIPAIAETKQLTNGRTNGRTVELTK